MSKRQQEHHDDSARNGQEPKGHGCGGCALTVDRRVFLRGTALAALGALTAGLSSSALAQTVRRVRSLRDAGAERVYDIPPADGASIDEQNEVILVRWQNKGYAFSSRCTHKGAPLTWQQAEGRVFCPKHKARFHPDGAHASGRSARDLDRYGIRKDGNSLVIDLDALHRADEEPEAWAAAVVQLG